MKMQPQLKVDQLADSLRTVHDPKEMLNVAASFFASFGATAVSYVYRPPLGLGALDETTEVFGEGYPEAWVRAYVEEGFSAVDPTLRMTATSGRPLWWSSLCRGGAVCPHEKAYLQLARAAGFAEGLTVPTFGPDGHTGFVAMPLDVPPGATTLFDLHLLESAAYALHRRIVEHVTARLVVPTLSPRECDVLRWIARGKSNAVIADILGLSPNTVDTYVRRLFLKLDATDRVTACLRAVAYGLVN